jgi:hypothetical protein
MVGDLRTTDTKQKHQIQKFPQSRKVPSREIQWAIILHYLEDMESTDTVCNLQACWPIYNKRVQKALVH